MWKIILAKTAHLFSKKLLKFDEFLMIFNKNYVFFKKILLKNTKKLKKWTAKMAHLLFFWKNSINFYVFN